jgi:CRISPR-associated protein Cas5t
MYLFVKAPFAAFRTFTAGAYRPTAPFITPSAAYGLVLNLAGVEMRFDNGQAPMTLIRQQLPSIEIALAAITAPQVQTIYQQLHNYPIGSTGKSRAATSMGAKYNIQPIRREFLSGLQAYIAVRGNAVLCDQVRRALRGDASGRGGAPRYGIPFLGDNSFMIDVLREEISPGPAHWYRRLLHDKALPGRCRLTVWIDRADTSRTSSALYAPLAAPAAAVPEDAWTTVPPLEGAGVNESGT